MADKDIEFERFAYDVCVSVLEKFGIFKPPDDMRKQNKYLNYDFLPCISRSVVMYAILIRDDFKNALEDEYNSAERIKEHTWNFFDEYLLKNDTFKEKDGPGKMCMSLALCTEYIQFVRTKDLTVSINKIVIKWNGFFEKNLRKDFEAEGGFRRTYAYLKSFPVHRLDGFLEEFISEYLLPYGAKEGIAELVKTCAEERGIPLDIAIFGIKKIDIPNENTSTEVSEEQFEIKDLGKESSDSAGHKEPKQEKQDSDGSRNASGSEEGDSEISKSEGNDSEITQNKLLGIPPHEETLRKIDPFFVENIPSPPKPQENKSEASETLPSPTDSEDLSETVEQIISKLEQDMSALRNLLFEHGLLSMKSGRRGSIRGIDGKGKKPPQPPPRGPEGLI